MDTPVSTPTAEACDGWESVEGPVGHITLRLTVKCEHCDAPVVLNGPSNIAHCDNCLKNGNLRRIPEELVLADEGMKAMGSPYRAQLYTGPAPQCSNCETRIPIKPYLNRVGAHTTIPCPSCGTGCPTYPAPAWLRADLPMALQVFGGDAETANRQGGLSLEVASEEAKPVVMSCPKCSGGLTINCESERTTECPYCFSSVFLPDELWKRLHPARTMTQWTMTFKGRLTTAAELEEEAARKSKAARARAREREREKKREARERERADEEDRKKEIERAARILEEQRAHLRAQRFGLIGLALFLLVLGGIPMYLFVWPGIN